jgi:hypothetical protein
VPDLLGQRHRDAVKAARRARRTGEPSDFHRLRIRCKRLRYTLEFVQEVYGDPAAQFIRHLARLQDLLGGLQDCAVSMERLHSLATRAQPPLSRSSVFLMGAVAEESRREASGLLHRARPRVKVLWGEEWQRLSQVLERLCIADDPRAHDTAVPAADAEAGPDTPANGWAHVEATTPDPNPAAPEPPAQEPSPAPAAPAAEPHLSWSTLIDHLPSGPA